MFKPRTVLSFSSVLLQFYSGNDKILKAARRIADLEKEGTIDARRISEAISYRNLDRDFEEYYSLSLFNAF